ncbi:unnamed protein product [Closterium sp. Naga37s-1]|nr:unnamed protein product [Closterium sp. Naga37s-1]
MDDDPDPGDPGVGERGGPDSGMTGTNTSGGGECTAALTETTRLVAAHKRRGGAAEGPQASTSLSRGRRKQRGALLPAPSAQPARGDPHMGSSPSNPPPDEPSPLQAHGGGFTGAILPHQHLVAAQDDAFPTRMEVVGVGVDRMTGEDEAAVISHTPLPTTACSPTLLPTAQLRGLEGELRPVRQPHATQPHGPAVLHISLAGPGHPPSLTDLVASEPSSGLGAAVSDLLAIQNTGIPLPTPTSPAPVVHAHEAPLMDLPLAAPILQEPFHPSPMETDLIFRPCASDADVGAPVLPASPHPSPSPAPPITTADSSEGTATADPTDTATSPDEVVRSEPRLGGAGLGAIDDMTVPHHEVRCSRFGVAMVIDDTVKYMLRDFASEAGFAVKVEDTTLILHLEAARARLQGLSGTGDGVPGQSGAPWGQQQQQGGLGRGAGGQEGREGQDGLASGGEEGGQQQQRQQQQQQ